eukprot:TRINITY_DN1435_c0_g1_i7.p1 TRINITY_DN1435_c0_g1~~TRINITY_DN1435_c0_g1_i7.p1  ORF type:complete len:567 (-),score=125.80 TRINITY_DN1435_c0_g1_i7:62-1762(-)
MESVAVQQQQAQCLPQIDFSAFLADPSRMNALHSRTQELLDARRRQTKQTVFGPIVDEPPVGALAVVNPFTTIPAAPVEDMHMLLMDADCVPDITLDCALAYCARGYCALNGLFSLLAKQNQVDTVEQIESHVNALRGMLEGMVINFPRGLPPPRVLCENTSKLQRLKLGVRRAELPLDGDGGGSGSLSAFTLVSTQDRSGTASAADGEMRLCRNNMTGQLHCMQLWDLSMLPGTDAADRAEKWRCAQLAPLTSPFIAKLCSTFEDEHHLCFVMDYVGGKDLLSVIKEGAFVGNEDKVRVTLSEIILGLEQLHQNNMVYCDLTPANVFLEERGHIKLTFLPLLKYFPMHASRHSFVAQVAEYVAPELLQTARHVSKAVDLWCLGALLYEMLAGYPPFTGNTASEVYAKILCGDAPALPVAGQQTAIAGGPVVSASAQDLVRRLLVVDPECRLGTPENGGFAELKRHPFFSTSGLDWHAVATGNALGPWHKLPLPRCTSASSMTASPPARTPTPAASPLLQIQGSPMSCYSASPSPALRATSPTASPQLPPILAVHASLYPHLSQPE